MTPRRTEAVVPVLQDAPLCKILQICIERARPVKEIVELTDIPSVTCYRHVKKLLTTGLLRVERSALSATGKPFDLYRSTCSKLVLTVDDTGIVGQAIYFDRTEDNLQRMWRNLGGRA